MGVGCIVRLRDRAQIQQAQKRLTELEAEENGLFA